MLGHEEDTKNMQRQQELTDRDSGMIEARQADNLG